MNIVFFAHFAGSPYHGMVFGHYCLAREWVRMGHNVTIIAASFAHTRYKQPEISKREITTEDIDGIRYIWIPCPAYQGDSTYGRGINILSFVLKTWTHRLPIEEADIIIASSHYPLAIFPAHKMAKANQAKLIFEVRDLWPLTLIELGGINKNHPFIMAMQWAEDFAYRHADYVVSVLDNAKEYMVQHGMKSNKFLHIPNGADLSVELHQKKLPEALVKTIEKAKQKGGFLIGYAGRMGDAHLLDQLIYAVKNTERKDLFVFFLGDGYSREKLQKKCRDHDLTNSIFFLGSVNKYQVKDFLQKMDALYLGLQSKPIFRYGISPTKLNDYLLAAKPVICAVDADVEAIKQSGAGIMCRSCESAEIMGAIETLRSMPSQTRKKMGEKGREWVQRHLDYRILAKHFLEGIGCGSS